MNPFVFIILAMIGCVLVNWLVGKIFLFKSRTSPTIKTYESDEYIRKEIPLSVFRDPKYALTMETYPRQTLMKWGIDPNRPFDWADDNLRQVRVIIQGVKDA